ncbi:hypothetical protein BRADI_5g10421v3 [Brachypodium distachyon]|uniref:Uncharacterized protein n=1 Tax=Brachypodium distachyon TaxID=15368 RepID=A0A2K2CGE7_BRADI|nr:hypothetical protein BRADI_5g10421v3 [Brachypodium distachyon]
MGIIWPHGFVGVTLGFTEFVPDSVSNFRSFGGNKGGTRELKNLTFRYHAGTAFRLQLTFSKSVEPSFVARASVVRPHPPLSSTPHAEKPVSSSPLTGSAQPSQPTPRRHSHRRRVQTSPSSSHPYPSSSLPPRPISFLPSSAALRRRRVLRTDRAGCTCPPLLPPFFFRTPLSFLQRHGSSESISDGAGASSRLDPRRAAPWISAVARQRPVASSRPAWRTVPVLSDFHGGEAQPAQIATRRLSWKLESFLRHRNR